jgi:hypothetical protein
MKQQGCLGIYSDGGEAGALGKFDASMGMDLSYVIAVPKTGDSHRGLACLLRDGMKAKGWLGDRGRSRIVLDRGKDGIT